MLDNLFFNLVSYLHYLPSIVISLLNIVVCLITVLVLKQKFSYAGLCTYMCLASIIGNIQVLYATSYEIINMEVLLGTIIFCSSFLACDLINLEFGEKKAKQAVYLTMLIDVFFLINIIITLGHKPINYSEYPNFSISKETMDSNIFAIKQIFLPIPRLLIASYISYFCAQLTETKLLNFIRNTNNVFKHNIVLFISNVFLDTFVFTFLGMYLLAEEPLNFRDFCEVSYSAIIIRVFCNFINSLFIKLKANSK